MNFLTSNRSSAVHDSCLHRCQASRPLARAKIEGGKSVSQMSCLQSILSGSTEEKAGAEKTAWVRVLAYAFADNVKSCFPAYPGRGCRDAGLHGEYLYAALRTLGYQVSVHLTSYNHSISLLKSAQFDIAVPMYTMSFFQR